jgi:hypothetical protein
LVTLKEVEVLCNYLVFISFGVNKKDQCVVVFDLLHGRFRGQGMLNDIVSIHPNDTNKNVDQT